MKNELKKISLFIVTTTWLNINYSQITYLEIRDNNIKSITQKNTLYLNSSITPQESETKTYYDEYGFDTLVEKNGKKYQTVKRNYNDQKQLISSERITYINNNDKDVYNYEYNKDGSFTEKETNQQYNIITLKKFDKLGRLIYLKIPDGTIKTFKYDKYNNQVPPKENVNTYNIKGKLIRTYPKNNKEFKTEYTYNLKGFLARMVTNYPEDYELDYKRNIINYFYQY